MNCMVCRGACCETFSMEVRMLPFMRDAQNWLEAHAFKIDRTTEIPRLHFDCRCTKLTNDGLCSIWEDRPMVCELFIAGSKQCLGAVKDRRTSKEYQFIRGEDDPLTLEEIKMAKLTREEGLRKIDDLIKELDQADPQELRCDLLEELEVRATMAKEEAESDNDQEEAVDDAEEDLEDDELDEDEVAE